MNTTLSKSELITAEIVRNYLESVSEEMSRIVENTATSQTFSEAHDYSTGIFHARGREVSIVARAEAVPVHIFAALASVETVLAAFHGDIRERDTFLVSDPYYGGSHLPDWTVVQPIFVDGEPRFFTSARGHVNDVGGGIPGGYNTMAREIWNEGFRCPPIRLFAGGKRVEDMWNLILTNTRQASRIGGDLQAMIGACIVGARRVDEIVTKYGVAMIEKSVSYALDYSEARLRADIATWPDGTYRAESTLDHDFAGGGEVTVRAAITVHGDSMTIDLTGSDPQVRGFVNSVAANTISNIYCSVVAVCPSIPVNSGYFRPVKIVLPEASVVNCSPPAPVGHSTICIGTDIIEAVMKALEQIVPERVGSASVDICNVRVYGTNPKNGEYFMAGDLNSTAMSSGATKGVDGWGGWAAPFCALKLPPLEMYEWEFPFRYVEMEYAMDTAAPGQWRGAPAIHYRRFHSHSLHTVSYVQGWRHPAQGYCGGRPGAGNRYVINEGMASELEVLESCYHVPVQAGSVVFSQSGAGGGWGDPFEREPRAVLEDVLDEYVSVEGARRDYGVVIDPDTLKLDVEATRKARAR